MKIKAVIKDGLIIWLASTWALWFVFAGLGMVNRVSGSLEAFIEASIAVLIFIVACIWLIKDLRR